MFSVGLYSRQLFGLAFFIQSYFLFELPTLSVVWLHGPETKAFGIVFGLDVGLMPYRRLCAIVHLQDTSHLSLYQAQQPRQTL